MEFFLRVPVEVYRNFWAYAFLSDASPLKKLPSLVRIANQAKKSNIAESLTPLTLKPTLYLYVNNPFAAQENLDNPVTKVSALNIID